MRCEDLWEAEREVAWEQAGLPFLRHLLTPNDVGRAQDTKQRACMLEATSLFLTHTDASAAPSILPAPASFGGVPSVNLAPCAHVIVSPAGATLDAAFWHDLVHSLPFSVLPARVTTPGLEAEAPWAGPRRRSARLRGRVVVPD